MVSSFLSLTQIASMYQPEQDWLFERFIAKLNSHKHLIIIADKGWGLLEYMNELSFQLSNSFTDIQSCFIDIKPVYSSHSFQDLFAAALSHSFPEEVISFRKRKERMNILELPAFIASKRKRRIAIFLTNVHLFHRFPDAIPFLRKMKLTFKSQKKCIFCLSGNNHSSFCDIIQYPGPLSGLGQIFELKHNPVKHRSASIRKLFHSHNKTIGHAAAVHMSFLVDNHPFYLKLLAWHALIRTHRRCTVEIVDNALKDLMYHFDYQYANIEENLTEKQFRLLKAIAHGQQRLYSNAIRSEYALGSSSNVARIRHSLEQKDLIDPGNKVPTFTDPIFRAWVRKWTYE